MESEKTREMSCSSSPSWCSAEEPDDTLAMEAAKTLVGLAQFAVRDRGSEFPDKTKDKGKLVRKRVKRESPPSPPESTLYDSVPSCPQHVVEDRVISTQQQESTCENVAPKAVKPEKDAGSYNSSRICLSGCPTFGGGRTSQNLSEAEKEEKRLRRVLANRESARRTIRRRQALCDKLTQKAAELARENEELKTGREAALKEYQMLETTNKKLKEKITEAMEPEIKQGSDKLQAVHPEFSASSANCPMFLYNGSFGPVFWPAAFHSPILGQSQEDPNGNHCRLACHLKNKQCGEHTSSSKTVEPSVGGGVVLPNAVKTASQAEIRLIDDLNQMPVGHESTYRCEEHIDAFSLDASQFWSSEHTAAVKHENGHDIDVRTSGGPFSSPAACDTAFIKGEDNFRLGISCSKTRIDAVAAAEARRRRKGLTKLKSFQVRNFQMQC